MYEHFQQFELRNPLPISASWAPQCTLWEFPAFLFHAQVYREGANREKLTVKKIINKEMFFFHRLCPLQTVKNRRKP